MTEKPQTASPVSNWPVVRITLNKGGTGLVSIAGSKTPIAADDECSARSQALAVVAERAREMNRPLRAWTSDPSGRWPLIVHKDGSVEQDDSRPAEPADEPELDEQLLGEVEYVEQPGDALPEQADPEDLRETPKEPVATETAAPSPAAQPVKEQAVTDEQTISRRELRAQRESFLNTETREKPATKGFRGWLASLGIHVSPSEAERAEREDQRMVSKHWPGPRTIAVVNGKGGASKTPTTALLSAVFARAGSQVIAWDNNQTRGTLGWRTEQGDHDSTVLDLLPNVDALLQPGAQAADLARYVHHQPFDKYDVLRSQPMRLASEQRVDDAMVARTHQALAKYYRLILMDSGNDESDPLWLKMIELADQIVVATTTRADHAEAGALLLDGLAEGNEHSAKLADNAVVVVSQAEPKAPAAEVRRVATGFSNLAREVVQVPFDPAMVDGHLKFDALRPITQRAWLQAAAAAARGL